MPPTARSHLPPARGPPPPCPDDDELLPFASAGPLPSWIAARSGSLVDLSLARNDIEGELTALGGTRLMIATAHSNPKLCGMIPASVRYAKGFNTYGTRLGQPC